MNIILKLPPMLGRIISLSIFWRPVAHIWPSWCCSRVIPRRNVINPFLFSWFILVKKVLVWLLELEHHLFLFFLYWLEVILGILKLSHSLKSEPLNFISLFTSGVVLVSWDWRISYYIRRFSYLMIKI